MKSDDSRADSVKGREAPQRGRADRDLHWLSTSRGIPLSLTTSRFEHVAVRDIPAAELAATQFLLSLGVDVEKEGLKETPGRMARAYAELLTPRDFSLTTFPNDEGYDELVVARAIPVRSVCEHHLLPFIGVAHVGYLPGARILGLSKLARVVEMFAHGPQVQERLTKQIGDWLTEQLDPRGVGVVIEAEHLCMTLRGVQAIGARTITSTMLGLLRTDPRSRSEFLAAARLGS